MLALAKSNSLFLPSKFYAHLSPGLEDIYRDTYHLTHHGEHYKMVLTDLTKLDEVGTSNVQSLSIQDLPEMQDLYAISYPDNWFDARMLETGLYTGIRKNNKLVSVAGVHAYSPEYKAVAIGNITTHPDYRNQGIATAVTAGLPGRFVVGYIGWTYDPELDVYIITEDQAHSWVEIYFPEYG